MNSAVATKPNVKQAVPFFGITNMDASLKFYAEGLGFNMKLKWIDEGKLRWCWLELGEAAIMLQEYRPESLPKQKVGEGVAICFICEDAIALYKEFISRGVNTTRPFVGNAMWVTGCSDPDGYRLEFESYTDVAEGTVLTDD
jgi:lactoylglutathione lyase